MTCRLFGDNPLFEPMIVCFQLDPKKNISVKRFGNSNIFIQENAYEDVVWSHDGNFVSCVNSLRPSDAYMRQ